MLLFNTGNFLTRVAVFKIDNPDHRIEHYNYHTGHTSHQTGYYDYHTGHTSHQTGH